MLAVSRAARWVGTTAANRDPVHPAMRLWGRHMSGEASNARPVATSWLGMATASPTLRIAGHLPRTVPAGCLEPRATRPDLRANAWIGAPIPHITTTQGPAGRLTNAATRSATPLIASLRAARWEATIAARAPAGAPGVLTTWASPTTVRPAARWTRARTPTPMTTGARAARPTPADIPLGRTKTAGAQGLRPSTTPAGTTSVTPAGRGSLNTVTPASSSARRNGAAGPTVTSGDAGTSANHTTHAGTTATATNAAATGRRTTTTAAGNRISATHISAETRCHSGVKTP
jgi:hypothetical protein